MFAFPLIRCLLLLSILGSTQLLAAETAPASSNNTPENKDALKVKSAPTATPGEVALRIAEHLAALQAARSQQNPLKTPGRKLVSRATHAKPTVPVSNIDLQSQWRYEGEDGPVRWSEMNSQWAKCGKGNRQSPIDIRGSIKVNLETIAFDYKPSGFTIVDNGHTIQVNLAPGNRITVLGRTYELIQFHFHRPSEERIDGRAYDMVAHLVHEDKTGKIAVIAVLIERGAAQNLIQTVWNNIPLEKNEVIIPSGSIDMGDILPLERKYYTYMGSMTTPPCSEGVLWMVMKDAVSASQEQIDIFAHLYPMNARPIQASAERLIKESN